MTKPSVLNLNLRHPVAIIQKFALSTGFSHSTQFKSMYL